MPTREGALHSTNTYLKIMWGGFGVGGGMEGGGTWASVAIGEDVEVYG